MTSPTIVAETPSNNSNASTTFTINTGSPLDGEGIVIFLSRDNGGSGTVTWPAGYTELYDLNDTDGFASGAAACKQAGASEPATIEVTSSVSGEFTSRAYRISGHLDFDTQLPDIGTVNNAGNTVTHNPPSVNVTGGSADILSIATLSFDTHNSNVNTYPTSYINTGVTRSGNSGSQCSLAYCTLAISAASSEDPDTFTLSTDRRGISVTLLIQAEDGTTVTVTGQQIANQQGATVVTGAALLTATGQELTGEQGATVVTGAALLTATGQELTGEQGAVVVTGAALLTATGQELTGEQGAVVVSVGGTIVVATGQELVSEQGDTAVLTAVNVALTGQELNGEQGLINVLIGTGSNAAISFSAVKSKKRYDAVKPIRNYNAQILTRSL